MDWSMNKIKIAIIAGIQVFSAWRNNKMAELKETKILFKQGPTWLETPEIIYFVVYRQEQIIGQEIQGYIYFEGDSNLVRLIQSRMR